MVATGFSHIVNYSESTVRVQKEQHSVSGNVSDMVQTAPP